MDEGSYQDVVSGVGVGVVVSVKHDHITSIDHSDVGKVYEQLFREASLNLDISIVVGKRVKVVLDDKGT